MTASPATPGTDPRSYVLPATVTSNIPAHPGPTERGIFAAARGLLLETTTALHGDPIRLHMLDNRGTNPDRHVDITLYATLAIDPADRLVLTLHWAIGGPEAVRGWTLTADRTDPDSVTTHLHVASADGRLPAPADLAARVAAALT
jgi:hypothetical protein